MNKLEVFIHSEAKTPRAVEAMPGETIQQVLERADVTLDTDTAVFVGEHAGCLTTLGEEDGREDSHHPVNPHDPIESAGVKHGEHVHCHRCRHIEISVNYGGRTKHHGFSPATTVAVATRWAKSKFSLTDTDAITFVLQFCNCERRPRANQHLGELTKFPECKLCFDLVPDKTKVEG